MQQKQTNLSTTSADLKEEEEEFNAMQVLQEAQRSPALFLSQSLTPFSLKSILHFRLTLHFQRQLYMC